MVWKVIRVIIVVTTLTVITQVGGLIYLAACCTHPLINRKATAAFSRWLLKSLSFAVLYVLCALLVIPPLAKKLSGRVPLPVLAAQSVKPFSIVYPLLNRHYVKPQLKEAILQVSKEMETINPGTEIRYLDAGFPFFNGFPLLPHRSHNDGKKLDLAFFYKDAGGQPVNTKPSWMGYGACEEPRNGEQNMPLLCKQKGYWQYSFLKSIAGWHQNKTLTLDEARTKQFITLLANNPGISKIFIEPHLKTRLHLTTSKIRFHGCQAVRHDDHVHVQLP